MDEAFERRPLIDRETLRVLQQRHDVPSGVQLTLHSGAFLLCAGIVVRISSSPLVVILFTVLLAAVWATLFVSSHVRCFYHDKGGFFHAYTFYWRLRLRRGSLPMLS